MRLLTLLVVLLTATVTYAQDNIVLRNGEEIPAKVLEVSQTDLKYRKAANPDGPVYTAPLRDVLLIKYANGTKDTFGAARAPMPARPDAPMMQRGYGRRLGVGRQGAPMMDAGPAIGLGQLRYHRSLFSRYYTSADGQRISISQTAPLMYNHPDAATSFDRGRSLRTWSIVTAVPAVALIGAGVGVLVASGGRDGRDRYGRLDPFGGRSNDPNDPNGTGNGTNRNRFDRGDGRVAGAVLAGSGVLLGAASLWLDHRATVQFRRAADRYNTRPSTSLRFRPSSQGVGVGAALTF